MSLHLHSMAFLRLRPHCISVRCITKRSRLLDIIEDIGFTSNNYRSCSCTGIIIIHFLLFCYSINEIGYISPSAAPSANSPPDSATVLSSSHSHRHSAPLDSHLQPYPESGNRPTQAEVLPFLAEEEAGEAAIQLSASFPPISPDREDF